MELEPAVSLAFSKLTRVATPPPPGDADVVLVPRFVDTGATKSKYGASFAKREVVVLLEWTVTDKAGTTVWLETVQGSAVHSSGTAFSRGKNLRLLVENAVKDAATQSARKMASVPELQKLTGATAR